ncbi:MAG TPA: peptidoglycan-binding protein [Gaiellaceae bacterium]|nr:peptidoglycan-binding protein [Gaiellaceae bacterium]
MTGREHDGEPEPDDWFAEPERVGRRPRPRTEEDWIETEPADRELGVGFRGLRPEAKLGLAVAALVIVLLIGLAAGGVFSSGGKKATPPTTAPTTATTTQSTQSTTTTPTFSVPSTPLTPNDTGTDVKTLQQALIALGYLKTKADGFYGPKTTAAATKFQQAAGLKADGIAGSKTLAALSARSGSTPPSSGTNPATFDAPTTTLKPGDTGSQVETLQRELAGLGYAPGTIDGNYGSGTVTAVKAFQTAVGLTPDGVVGPRTLQALKSRATSG